MPRSRSILRIAMLAALAFSTLTIFHTERAGAQFDPFNPPAVSITVDRGPGSTYYVGDSITFCVNVATINTLPNVHMTINDSLSGVAYDGPGTLPQWCAHATISPPLGQDSLRVDISCCNSSNGSLTTADFVGTATVVFTTTQKPSTTTNTPSRINIPGVATSSSGTVLGGLDLDSYCNNKYGSNYTAVPLDNTNWACQTNGGNIGAFYPITIQSACVWQYNRQDVVAQQQDPNNVDTWVCSTSSSPGLPTPLRGNVQIAGFLPGQGDHTGRDNYAIDFVSDNSAVYPVAAGTVVYSAYNCERAGYSSSTPCSQVPASYYGNVVVIDHGNGYYSIYAHLASDGWLPSTGTGVTTSTRIGTMSDSGCQGQCGVQPDQHLHFAVHVGNPGLTGDLALFDKSLQAVDIWDSGNAWYIQGLPNPPGHCTVPC